MTRRTAQIESTLRQALAKVLGNLADPRIGGMVSITRVEVSPDLREARVHVSVMPEQKQKTTLHGLRHAAGHIQRLVKKQVAFRIVPRLDFRPDQTLKTQARVYQAIREGLDRTDDQDRGPQTESQNPEDASDL